MLQFSATQMAALYKADFEGRALPELCAYLRREHGTALSALDDAALDARVRAAVAAAEAFGLTTRNDVYGFVTLELTVAEGFHRDPEVVAAVATVAAVLSPFDGPAGDIVAGTATVGAATRSAAAFARIFRTAAPAW